MEFTLDSVTHAQQCINEYEGVQNTSYTPQILPLKDILNNKDGIYYFGVITTGSNVTTCTLTQFGEETISIVGNSQIIELFDKVTCVTDAGDPKGIFRGFVLNSRQ